MRRAAAVLALLAACDRASAVPSAGIQVIGGPGSGEGRFATPRAAALGPTGWLYVVDKAGRIQCFNAARIFRGEWSTPAVERGRPTGLAVDREGNVLVADTHYHRILRYSSNGKLLGQFGSEGRGPGEFVYPTGIAVAPDGRIFVSEFGGNDRIQVFTPEGKPLHAWGSYGEGPGQFKRPQGIALGGDRLYVADAANHRVQVFSLAGAHLGTWEGLKYPYSASVDPEGNVLVAEYGSHRVSKFRPDGTLVGRAGRAGSAPGELNTPWGALAAGDRVIVIDSGNHRLQVWPASFFSLEPPRSSR